MRSQDEVKDGSYRDPQPTKRFEKSYCSSFSDRLLAIREQVLGLQHPDTAQSLSNLGTLLEAQSDLAGAKAYYERALQIFRLCLGQDHALTQTVLANLEALDAAE